ncbi:IS30 family transposase, partial [Corynebacterium diphtheriae]|nr:IS30 family transposase [Corynebacterium diphtheriae bv. mitis]MBN4652490.1 IS30 family transposase [Corynebacterium diphtheriae bv. mitis]MBN4653522.1 IS30 family transposase [Corynebacterium diphtheriae bv. mitis]MBN4653921.1 IS30 family transposase [Corynebacterium diphtheriae bv. mitis]
AYTLNNRPRKVLGFRTPAEVFNKQLQSIQNNSAATTD